MYTCVVYLEVVRVVRRVEVVTYSEAEGPGAIIVGQEVKVREVTRSAFYVFQEADVDGQDVGYDQDDQRQYNDQDDCHDDSIGDNGQGHVSGCSVVNLGRVDTCVMYNEGLRPTGLRQMVTYSYSARGPTIVQCNQLA